MGSLRTVQKMARSSSSLLWVGLFVLAANFGVVACDSAKSSSVGGEASARGAYEETEPVQGASVHYSSFGVQLRQGGDFDLISFKDVGLGREEPEPTGPLLETIAQSLAYELKLDDSFDFQTRVVHDMSLADPSSHTYCEGERLYVDVWRSESPERWGYSLWSGCSESTKFAWGEVPVDGDEKEELGDAVEPLTRGIADSLTSAAREGCYRRNC